MNETKITITMPKPDEILCPKLDVCFKMLFGSEKNKAILVSFLKSILSEPDDDIKELTLLNPMTEKEYPDDKMEVHLLELSKIPEESDDTMRYTWVKFLSSDQEEMEMLSEKEDAIKLAYEELQRISLDDKKRWIYESRLKALLDEEFRLGAAMREGLAQGRTEGIAQGRTEGAEESQRKIAKALISEGVPVKTILAATGLSEKELNILIK